MLQCDDLVIDAVLTGVHEIQHVRRLREHQAEVLGNDRRPVLGLVGLEQIVQGAIGQLHGNDQVAWQAPDVVDMDEVGVAQLADELDRAALLGCPALQVIAGQELESDRFAIGSAGLPDLAERTATEGFAQAVARYWLETGF